VPFAVSSLRAPPLHGRAKLLSRSAQARSDGTDGDLQQLGDLRRRQLLELEQHEDRAKVERQGLEQRIEQGSSTPLISELFRARKRIFMFGERAIGAFATSACATPLGRGHADRRGEQESALAADVDLVDATSDNPKHLLDGVIGVGLGGAKTSEAPPHEIVMGVDQPAQAVVGP
jgi:hypothetical protein